MADNTASLLCSKRARTYRRWAWLVKMSPNKYRIRHYFDEKKFFPILEKYQEGLHINGWILIREMPAWYFDAEARYINKDFF